MSRRTVIVTGAFGTLGTAVADRFERDGAAVARIDFAPAPTGAPDHHVGGVDLADEVAARAALDRIEHAIGSPSVLVNVAGRARHVALVHYRRPHPAIASQDASGRSVMRSTSASW